MRRGKSRRFISFGVRKVNVPNLSGLTRAQAQTSLSSVGLSWTESATDTGNVGINLNIVDQGIPAGTAVLIGSQVPFTYYNYVAPPNFNPGFGPDFSNPGFNPGFSPGFNPGFQPAFNEPAFNEPAFDTPVFGGSGDLTNLDLSALFDFGSGGKSIGITTLVRTTDGLVKAGDLQVGDTLLSVNIEGFPYESAEGVTAQAIAWSDNNPNIIPEITNIVALYKTQSAYAVVINEDIFSQYHYILIKRNGVSKFETSVNIVKETDLVYSYDTSSWEPIYLYEIVQVPHDIISINCEPYDMFFTERMLTHDSSAI